MVTLVPVPPSHVTSTPGPPLRRVVVALAEQAVDAAAAKQAVVPDGATKRVPARAAAQAVVAHQPLT
jgi:hypothetical protein